MQRRALCLSAIVLTILSASTTAASPRGGFGIITGITRGALSAAGKLDTGFVWGGEAAFAPWRSGQTLGLGVAASVTQTLYGAETSAPLVPTLETVEVTGTVRFYVAPQGESTRRLFLGAGVSTVRAGVELPPDEKTSYWGPLGELGYQQRFLIDELRLGFAVRLGPVISAPTTASALMTLSVTL